MNEHDKALADALARAVFLLDPDETIDNPGAVTCDYLGGPYHSGQDPLLRLDVHAGFDFRAKPPGEHKVYSIVDGTILETSFNKSVGRSTIPIYVESCDCTLLYLHLDSFDDDVKEGTEVKRRAPLGFAGTVGAEESHLHLEVRKGRQTRALTGNKPECGDDGYCSMDEIDRANKDPLAVADLWLGGRVGAERVEVASALVIDRSASMVGYITGSQGGISEDPRDRKKLENAKQAAKAYSASVDEKDMVSVSSFSEGAGTQVSMSVVGHIRSELDGKIEGITAESSTNIAAGLEEAYGQLNQADSAVSRIAILLSDGENTGPSWRPVVKRFKGKRWPICTIGFGSRSEPTPLQVRAENELREIASATGCVYEYADTNNVVNKYQELSAHATNRSVVLSATDILGPRDRVTYPFSVSEGADSFAIMSSWQGSKLGITLTGPKGEVISTSGRIPAEFEYDEGDTFQVLKMPSSQGGQWRAELAWVEPPEEPEQIHVSVTERSNIYVRMHGLRPRYEQGEPVSVSVQAAEVVGSNKAPLQDANVHAEVLAPGGDFTQLVRSQSRDWSIYEDVIDRYTSTLELRDDGRHGDYGAGDGVYAEEFRDTKRDGVYIVKAIVRGRTRDGNIIEKAVQGYFQVGDIRSNSVSSSQTFNILREVEHDVGSIDNETPYSEELLREPADAIEELQADDSATEIEKLLQQ